MAFETAIFLVLLALFADQCWQLYQQLKQKLGKKRCGRADCGAYKVAAKPPFLLGFTICAIFRALMLLFEELV